MRKLIRIMMRIALIFTGLVVFIYGVLYAVNFRDQVPNQAAIAMESLLQNRPPMPDNENAYVFVMGFDAPDGNDPLEVGARRIAWINEALKLPFAGFLDEPERETYDPVAHRNNVIEKVLMTCAVPDPVCGHELEANKKAIGSWLKTNEWVLARYRALLATPTWQRTVAVDVRMPFPPYQQVLEGQRMQLMRAWMMARDGNVGEVSLLLDADMRFWREVLASTDILVDRMVATAALLRNMKFGALVLRQLPAEKILHAVPKSWTAALTDDERSMKLTLAGEWKFGESMWFAAKRGAFDRSMWSIGNDNVILGEYGWAIIAPFFQPQDSSNHYAEYFGNLSNMLDASFDELPRAVKDAAFMESELVGLPRRFSRLYNLAGDILMTIEATSYSSYASRVHDLEGVRRLVLATIRMRAEGVSKNEVAERLGMSELRNPYTDEPFIWEHASTSVVFEGLEPSERNNHFVYYGD